MQADGVCFRTWLLLLSAFLSLPGQCVFMMLGILQPEITKTPNCSLVAAADANVTDCCRDCLGVGDQSYNMMFGLYWLSGTVGPLAVGLLLDRFGVWVSVPVAVLLVAGSGLVAAGSCVVGSAAMLPLLFGGFALVGFGFATMIFIRDRVISFWYKDKDLRLAFGISVAINRSSSIFVFPLTEKLRESAGLQWTLVFCVLLSLLAVVCAVCVTLLDASGSRQLGMDDELKEERKSVGIFDLRRAPCEYWLLVGGVSLLCCTYYTFVANCVEFVHEKFGFTKQAAAVSSGFHSYICVVLSPLLGLLLDRVGRSGFFLTAGCALLTLSLLLLTLTPVHPALGLTFVGAAYCSLGPAGLASVVLLVDRSVLVIAGAMCVGAEGVAEVLSHSAIGAILGDDSGQPIWQKVLLWRWAMCVLLATAAGATVFAVALTALSHMRNGNLTKGSGGCQKRVDAEYELIEDKKGGGDAANETKALR